MNKKIKAWYFSYTKKLTYGDNRRIVVGRTHMVKFPVYVERINCHVYRPVLCAAGLHGSIKPLHALHYKSYLRKRLYVWRVELSGMMDIGVDKIAAEKRTYLWGYDASDVIDSYIEIAGKDKFINPVSMFEKQNRRLYRMLMEGRAANV